MNAKRIGEHVVNGSDPLRIGGLLGQKAWFASKFLVILYNSLESVYRIIRQVGLGGFSGCLKTTIGMINIARFTWFERRPRALNNPPLHLKTQQPGIQESMRRGQRRQLWKFIRQI